MKNVLIDYEKMSSGNKESLLPMVKAFEKKGGVLTDYAVDAKIKRQAGATFRDGDLVFADSQKVTISVKQSGDIFQIKINGRVFPIKNQDDHEKAVDEIMGELDKRRTAFQKSLTRAKKDLPSGMKTATPKIEEALTEKVASYDKAIEDGQALVMDKKTELAAIEADIAKELVRKDDIAKKKVK